MNHLPGKRAIRSLGVLAASFALLPVQAQSPGSVQWSASATHAQVDGEWVVSLKADIQKGWHVYAATQPAGGPLPLVIKVEPGAPFQLNGTIGGSSPLRHHDTSFNLDTEFYTDSFALKIPVKATSGAHGDVPIAVRFQMCSDTTCMPPKTIHLVANAQA